MISSQRKGATGLSAPAKVDKMSTSARLQQNAVGMTPVIVVLGKRGARKSAGSTTPARAAA